MPKKKPKKGYMTFQYFKRHAYYNEQEGIIELSAIPVKKLKKILAKQKKS